jgi:hypothetical protein
MAAAVDTFSGDAVSLVGPCRDAAAVTPSDANDLGFVTRALYVGGAGAVTVIMANGETVASAAVPAGTTIPIRVSRVKATGTAASSIVALW